MSAITEVHYFLRRCFFETDDQLLKKVIAGNTPTRVMETKLERTPAAVQHANDLALTTKPVNQRPNKKRRE